jgi:nucleotide-binding universal stress UspA family protein
MGYKFRPIKRYLKTKSQYAIVIVKDFINNFVYVINIRRYTMYKKILVPLDGSQLAEAVLPHAEALAKSEGAEIVLLSVPVTPSLEFLSRSPGLANKVIKETEIETESYLDLEVAKLQKDGIKVTSIMREGPIPDMILKVADEIHADVIAMSTHGRSGVQRWLMGSVADRVVHHSHIPVMLIHPFSKN